MPNYTHTWTNSASGWTMRLLMVPYDSDLAQTAVPMGLGTVTLGAQEKSFNELPLGMHNAETLTVDIRITDIPSAMATRIKNKISPISTLIFGTDITDYARNVFVLYSNRGSGPPTTVEFCGVQARTFGGEYTKNKGHFDVSIELEDSFAHACKMITGRNVCYYLTLHRATYSDYAYGFTTIYNITQGAPKPDARVLVDVNGDPDHVRFISWVDMQTALGELIRKVMQSYTTRAAGSGNSVAYNGALPSTTVQFYRATEGLTRGLGTQINTTDLLVPAFVEDDNNNVLGGYASTNDARGFTTYETLFDWFRDMSEQFGCKLVYDAYQTGGAGSEVIVYNVNARYIVNAAIVAMEFGRAVTADTYKITESATTLGFAEVRYEGGGDQDVTTSKFLNRGSRSARSFSARVTLHNAPSRIGIVGSGGVFDVDGLGIQGDNVSMWSLGFLDTDRLYYFFGTHNIPVRVHETTRMYSSAADYVEVSAAGSALDIKKKNTSQLVIAYTDMQANACLHNCLSEFAVAVFGNEISATFDLEWPIISDGVNVMTSGLGDRHSISGDMPALLSQYDWTTAIVTAVKVDWEKGTSTLSYVTL